jgi:integral membrane sensor domain MASE1
LPFSVYLYWSLADLWQVLLPMLAFRLLKADVGLRTKRDFAAFLLFGWLINNLVGAIWGTTMFVVSGQFLTSNFENLFGNWFLGNLAVTLIITPLLLKFVTPLFKKKGLIIETY